MDFLFCFVLKLNKAVSVKYFLIIAPPRTWYKLGKKVVKFNYLDVTKALEIGSTYLNEQKLPFLVSFWP